MTFQENQKFTQLWIKVILLIPIIIALVGLFMQGVKGVPFGNTPLTNVGLMVLLLFGLIFYYFFSQMGLTTKIDSSGIQMKFAPLSSKKINWVEVESAEVLDYGFVGGWGIRMGTKYGTVYNIEGSKGLALSLKNGKKFLIGTQKESEMEHTIKHWKTIT